MSNYTKNTNWTSEQGADSNPALFDAEFDELATVSATKADLASPTFTGTPTLPTGAIATTQSPLDGSTAVATTAYVDTADALKADLASPALTGVPTAPTAAAATDTTQVATTAHVKAVLAARTTSSHSVTNGATQFTNSTGADLALHLRAVTAGTADIVYGYIDGNVVAGVKLATFWVDSFTLIVPDGSTYGFTRDFTAATLTAYATNS